MRMKPILLASDAAAMMAAARSEAARNGWAVTIAIVDEQGSLLALERLDGAPLQSPTVATAKARGAALFRRPTKVYQDALKQRPEIALLPNIMPVQGGVPVTVEDECVGGIGVSGVQSHEDEQVATAGAAALPAGTMSG